ncbi:MAG: universal stress protein, partial [Lewinella sp.]|nr:universal stress protein [Lewinella sp.]
MANPAFSSILIPTDFSATARIALDAGLALAERFDTPVHLLHVVPLP